jgi:acetyl esterase
MQIDPELWAVIEARMAASSQGGDLATMRRDFSVVGAALPRPEVGAVSDHAAPGPAGAVPIRLYRPLGAETPPLLIFIHGGGFMFGDLDSHDAACRHLVAAGGCAVAAIDYRLAPEHPFPAGLDDCQAAAAWLLDHAAGLGLDADRIGLGGESAGGNLAAVLARRLSGRAGMRPMLQLLVHPAVDFRFQHPSITEVVCPGLTPEALHGLRAVYLGDADITDPDASPFLAADLEGLPPAIVVTVEVDPLRDEGEAYALKLAAAEVQTTVVRLKALTHGFMFESADIPIVARAFERIGALVRLAFAHAPARQFGR